jgi:superoxide dismutase
VKNGIPGLLTKEAFNEAWMEYQQYMMDELNACSAGTTSPTQITIARHC